MQIVDCTWFNIRSKLTLDDWSRSAMIGVNWRLVLRMFGRPPTFLRRCIKNYCVEVSSKRCLRSSSHRHLVIPPPSKTVLFGERSFTVEGPSLWNHLPDNVKEAGSIELFKQRLKCTYLNNLLKCRLFLNFITVPLTLVVTMLLHFKQSK